MVATKNNRLFGGRKTSILGDIPTNHVMLFTMMRERSWLEYQNSDIPMIYKFFTMGGALQSLAIKKYWANFLS